MVLGMNESFKWFGIGFGISFALLFLILVAQFKSFVDPFLIMLAIPMGFMYGVGGAGGFACHLRSMPEYRRRLPHFHRDDAH